MAKSGCRKSDLYKLHSAIWNAKVALDRAAKLINICLNQETSEEGKDDKEADRRDNSE